MRKGLLKRCAAVAVAALMVVSGVQPLAKVPDSKAATKYIIEDPSEYYQAVTRERVSVHDPAIIKDPNSDRYYIFGSHLAWAYSTDLETWTTFTNNISTNYATLFKDEFEWASAGDDYYDPKGNVWAPDVIWNPKLGDKGKWCMYISINGWSWNSVICLLTADRLDGNWTYVGPVVYSGFTESGIHDYTKTDYKDVTKESELPARFKRGAYTTKCGDDVHKCAATTWNTGYGAHAIDANVFYDQTGKLWFAYGSWTGGLYMFPLDEDTGFRDTSVTYEYDTTKHTDPYMGQKIGGGSGSGEATYIKYIDGYYYFFTSYGALTANGGYNMRVFRSENPDGPYTDVSGDAALDGGDVNGNGGRIGTRLMGYYKWSYWKYGHAAQGHNSVITDDEGKSYLVYHTRTTDGTEGHTVRVHQLFTTKSGYLTAAPFEYSKTDKVKTGYSADEIAGDYEILYQKNTNHAQLEYNKPSTITLTSDGKITKEGSEVGTWTEEDGSARVDIVLDGVKYEGTFVSQTMEETNVKTLCFTVVGAAGQVDTCLWGAKYPTDDIAVAMTASRLDFPKMITNNVDLTTEGAFGAAISWDISSPFILGDGTVIRMKADAPATLTATITKGNYSCTKVFETTVASSVLQASKVAEYYTDEPLDLTKGTASVDNPLKNMDISNGVTIKFDVKRTGTFDELAAIWALDESKHIYFTDGTYFGVNNGYGIMDANLYNGLYTAKFYVEGVDFLGQNNVTQDYVTVELSVDASGFSVSVNGNKAYDNTMIDSRSAEDKKTATSVPEGKVAGQNEITDYSKLLDDFTSSKKINFGFGTWWSDRAFKGLLKNFEVWVEPVAQKEEPGDNYYYYEDYENSPDISSLWTSGDLVPAVATADGNKYLTMYNPKSGQRSATSSFEFDDDTRPAGEYLFETDLQLNGSDGANLGSSTTAGTGFQLRDTDGKYIVKLFTEVPKSQAFFLNDTDETIDIPRNTWVSISVHRTEGNEYTLTITNKKTGVKIVEDKAITPTTNNLIDGLYVEIPRGGSLAHASIYVDNTIIRMPGLANYTSFNQALSTAKKFAALQESQGVYDDSSVAALTGAIESAESLGTDLKEEQQSLLDDAVVALNEAVEGLTCKEHVYNEGEVITAATCTEDGTKKAVCFYCGHEDTVPIPAGHVWGAWELTKAATATTPGEKTRKCKNCDEEQKEEVAFCGEGEHTFSEKETRAATCAEEGERTRTCSVCGYVEKVAIAKIAHTPGAWEIQRAASAEENGIRVRKCTECGEIIESEDIELCEQHTFGAGKETKKATCTEEGEKTFTCSVCGLEKTEPIEKIAHTPGDWEVIKEATTAEEGERVKKCTVCGEILETEAIARLKEDAPGTTGTPGAAPTATPPSAATPTPAPTATPAPANSGKDSTSSGDTETTPKEGTTQTVGSVKYKILSNSSATVIYSGLTAKKKKTVTSVTIPAKVKIKGKSYKVTQVAASAFANCGKLKKVTIGANVKTIGKKAFYKDARLKTIVIKSKQLKKVGAGAFKGIHKKATIKVPKAKKTGYKKILKKKGQAGTVKIK